MSARASLPRTSSPRVSTGTRRPGLPWASARASSPVCWANSAAAGRSNKEIAQRLNVSPNTVKTHVAQVYEKLGARRRTEAINKARALGIVP